MNRSLPLTENPSLTVVPLDPDISGLNPTHQSIQRRAITEQRRAMLGELRFLGGVGQIVKRLSPNNIYRLVLPEGEVLQKGTDGLYRGVLAHSDGRIAAHARFEKVPARVTEIAAAAGTQILLINIAVRLDKLEKAIAGLSQELHDDRIALINAGARLYEQTFWIEDPENRKSNLRNAIQSITEGFEKVTSELRRRISRLPAPENLFKDNWLKSKSSRAREELELAEECLRAVVRAAALLAQCFSALGEPSAGAEQLKSCFSAIRACGLANAAACARLVPLAGTGSPPENVWREFDALLTDLAERITERRPGSVNCENQPIAFEFTASEI